MTTNLENITWSSIDDVLETRNENGHLKANILFAEEAPTIADMDGFDRVLCFVKGQVTGGGTANIHRTAVLLNEENGYIATVPFTKPEGWDEGHEIIGVDTSRIQSPVLGEETITIEKATALTISSTSIGFPITYTHVNTYTTTFAYVGEDWAEIVDVTIVVTIPLKVEYRNGSTVSTTLKDTAYHGGSLEINLEPTAYTPQYLYVYGSRSWKLDGVDTGKVSVTPSSGVGLTSSTLPTSYTQIIINKASSLTSENIVTTTFRIVAEDKWVDVTVNVLPVPPPKTGTFINPPAANSEVGAGAIGDVYTYIDSTTSLVASFYVETSAYLNEAVTVSASIQSSTNNGGTWGSQTGLTQSVTTKQYTEGGQARYYYKIDVSRAMLFTAYLLATPGTYLFRLNVSVDGNAMTPRIIYLTMQPDVRVYREIGGTPVEFITTSSTTISANPVNIQKTIALSNVQSALDARNVLINESNNESVFVQSTLPMNMYGDDFTVNTADPTSSGASTYWLAFQNKIRMTRHAGNAGTTVSGWSSSAIKTEANKEYVELATGSATALVKLGLEKFPLPIPLSDQFGLELRGAVEHYIENGGGTKGTSQITLPLSVNLQTPPTIKITPPNITLNEDNNYTAFVSVDTNDDANWTLSPGAGILVNDVSAISGTGRGSVVVKKAGTFDWDGEDFQSRTLTAESIVNSITKSATADVHVERYSPTRNALIPKLTGSLDQTLTNSESVGAWSTSATFTGVASLTNFPTKEYAFDNGKAHRIRSWSLQSVGALSGQRATRLILSGKTLSGQWKILDDTGVSLTTSAFYLATKPRVDRIVQHSELVDTIRITAVGVTSVSNGNPVLFPKIQVFAGEPVIVNKMTSNSQDGISVSSSTVTGYKVFDKVVKDTDITPIGPANFYLRSGEVRQNRVADSGANYELLTNDFQSLVWLSLAFPSKRLIGYLYSIDKVIGEGGNFEINSYAGTISFEYRKTNDASANSTGSDEGGWESLGLISLDKCVGYTRGIGQGQLAEWLASNQEILNQWTKKVLGLSGADRNKAYLIDEANLRAIRFLNSTGTWHDEGLQLDSTLDAMHDVENTTHYADIAGTNLDIEQFRFVVRSVMNTINPTNQNPRVQMPEMQFFGLPTDKINTGDVASVDYLKVEDANGNLHDILGRHKTLLRKASSSVRLYVGKPQNHATTGTYANKIYLAVQNTNGTMPTSPSSLTMSSSPNGYAYGTVSSIPSTPTYYEIYIYDKSDKKIILSSGYTGGTS